MQCSATILTQFLLIDENQAIDLCLLRIALLKSLSEIIKTVCLADPFQILE